jgi:DNA uptake protein ComE-like DNA-binding protein
LKANFYVCASVEIQKININTTPLDQLENNPYFTPDQAAKIVNLRENQKFTSMEDIKNTGLFTDKILKRLANYLEF